MKIPRAFISFQMEDRYARDFLVQQAKDSKNDIEFRDYSVQNPWDSSWKTECKKRIAATQGTIVLIGPTTYDSDAVLWEIAETKKQGHPIFGIQISEDKTHRIPVGLSTDNVIRWNFVEIVRWLKTWR